MAIPVACFVTAHGFNFWLTDFENLKCIKVISVIQSTSCKWVPICYECLGFSGVVRAQTDPCWHSSE